MPQYPWLARQRSDSFWQYTDVLSSQQPHDCRIVAGGVAGGVSKSVVAPFERLKIVMQLDSQKRGLTDTAARLYREGGIAGLFRSNLASVTKVLPYAAIQYGVLLYTPFIVLCLQFSHLCTSLLAGARQLDFYLSKL